MNAHLIMSGITNCQEIPEVFKISCYYPIYSLGRLAITTGSDHCLSVRPLFSNKNKF